MHQIKIAGIVGSLSVMALETVTDQPDLLRYALTQGGLFAVVLVLLWSYRKDFTAVLDQKAERVSVLTELVQRATEAQTKSADATATMARSVEQMTVTLSKISERRTP